MDDFDDALLLLLVISMMGDKRRLPAGSLGRLLLCEKPFPKREIP